MSYLRKNWKNILVICIFPALVLYGIWRKYQVTHFPRYTIATTTRKIFTAKSGFEIEFLYKIDGQQYKSYGADIEKYHIEYPNARYLLKYSYKNPSACEIQWDLKVPDTIGQAPLNGWKEPPF
jgi:hypothetical protein